MGVGWAVKSLIFSYLRWVAQILPTDSSVLSHEGKAWLTLITCKGFNDASQAYQLRVAVKAVLLSVEGK
jgi:sortase (surface protein transpeptidase)